MKSMDIAVIGAGASGMAAAITALEYGKSVVIYEANEMAGRKILATGNGKCNFTNEMIQENAYHTDDQDILKKILDQYTGSEIRKWFELHGMESKLKNGYCYPFSEQSSTVQEILLSSIEQKNGKIIYHAPINEINYQNGLFVIRHGSEQTAFHRCILACGSDAGNFIKPRDCSPYDCAENFGLSITSKLPALTKCICFENDFKILSGVRTDAELTVYENKTRLSSERGEVQFTSQGLSGIVFFQLSGLISEKKAQGCQIQVHLNFFPDFSSAQVFDLFEKRFQQISGKTIETFFLGLWNKKIMTALCRRAGLKITEQASHYKKEQLWNVFSLAEDFVVSVKQMASLEEAQVCRGGISLLEIRETLEAKKFSGLFICGELLNVDGICGGYNLHWAWASGITAGKNAANF